jgi:hypothetical protein
MTTGLKTDAKDSEVHDTLTINNQKIDVVIKELPQSKLRFFVDNPRIYSIVRHDGKEPTQDEIQERLLEMEYVKELKEDIKRNGGLIDPVIVRDGTFEVLEGNSRLAAYRVLAKSDPITWGRMKCMVLPSSISDGLIFALLGQYHIKGKKDWAPYEQAGFLHRRCKEQKVDVETLAKEIGYSKKRVKHLIDTYQFMVDHEENDTRKWSYYDEYLKSSKINRTRKKYPELDKTIVDLIRSEKIDKAVAIRDELPKICLGPGKNLKKFMDGKASFSRAFEVAEEEGGDNRHLRKLIKIRAWLTKPEVEKGFAKTEDKTRHKLLYELNKISARVHAQIKKLED